MKMRQAACALSLALLSQAAAGEVVKKAFEYKIGSDTFEGYVARPASRGSGRMPGILVAHDWMGLGAKTMEKADAIAELGFVVMAVDLYGKGVRPADKAAAGKTAGAFYKDRKMFRERMRAGLEELGKMNEVEPGAVVALGYCFGGTAALELARTGADLKGVISFHGNLDSTAKEDGKRIKARVLALHGADDPFVKPEALSAFEEEMRFGKVDWQLIKYGNAVHAFTDKGAGADPSQGAAYNEKADQRSWQEMKAFLAAAFSPNPVL